MTALNDSALGGVKSAVPAPLVSMFDAQDPLSHSPVLKIEERSSQEGDDVLQEREFKGLNGELAGSEWVRLRGSSLQLLSYLNEDTGSGERTEVKVAGGQASVTYRSSKDGEVKTKNLAWGADTYTGNLLPAVILKHWTALADGQTIDLDLLVPFRLETIGFRLLRANAVSDDKTITIIAEASNWLIRRFAPVISFVYSADKPPRLLKYIGPPPVQIAGGKTKMIEIDFHRAPLAER